MRLCRQGRLMLLTNAEGETKEVKMSCFEAWHRENNVTALRAQLAGSANEQASEGHAQDGSMQGSP